MESLLSGAPRSIDFGAGSMQLFNRTNAIDLLLADNTVAFLSPSSFLPNSLIQKECGADAKKSMQFFISKAAGKAFVHRSGRHWLTWFKH